MKFSRYAQACVLIETKGSKILIDPGNIDFKDEYLDNEWQDVDIILVTHKHKDHIHTPVINKLVDNGAKFYSSKEVADTFPELSPKIVKEGDVFHIDGLQIEVVKAIHGFAPYLKGGNEVNENIGFIIDDGKCRAYHTSDTIGFDNNYKCDVLFVPVCGYGLVLDPFSAKEFAKDVEAKLIIPMHYDHPNFPADLELVESEFSDLNFKFLDIGESVEF